MRTAIRPGGHPAGRGVLLRSPLQAPAVESDAPLVLSAVMDSQAAEITINFDRELESNGWENEDPFTVRFNNIAWDVLAGNVNGSSALLAVTPVGSWVSPNELVYSPPPHRFRSLTSGTPAAPLTIPLGGQ